MKNKAVVFLADGFEEIEAITCIDVLRRAEIEVVVAAVDCENNLATGAHGLEIMCDAALEEVYVDEIGITVCPGGLPGATNLAQNQIVLDFIRQVYDDGGIVTAICAAPIVLKAAGLLEGREYTCYPSFEKKIGGNYTGARVQVDDRIITACGPGASMEFAFAILGSVKPQVIKDLWQGMQLM